jgi:BMFP domain-containing protein YqiC
MQTNRRLLDDLARVASGATGTFQGIREDVEGRIREKLERVLQDMEFVTREEFDAVAEMAARARTENDELRSRVEALEAVINPAHKNADD